MSLRVARNDANSVLKFLDKMATAVQKDPARFGLTPNAMKVAVTYIDSASDDFERKAFGEESLDLRQAELSRRVAPREAEVQQSESDEPYMGTFSNPQAPVQTESDEPYMGEFNTDTTSEVRDQYPSGSFTPAASHNPFD